MNNTLNIRSLLENPASKTQSFPYFEASNRLGEKDVNQIVNSLQVTYLRKTSEGKEILAELYRTHKKTIGILNKPVTKSYIGPINKEIFIKSYPLLPWVLYSFPQVITSLDPKAFEEQSAVTLTFTALKLAVLGSEQPIGNLITLYDLMKNVVEYLPFHIQKVLQTTKRDVTSNELSYRLALTIYTLNCLKQFPVNLENITRSMVERVDTNLALLTKETIPNLEELVSTGYVKIINQEYFLEVGNSTNITRTKVQKNHLQQTKPSSDSKRNWPASLKVSSYTQLTPRTSRISASISTGSQPIRQGKLVYQLDNVSKIVLDGHEQKTILKNVTAQIYAGEFCGVVGESGAGKSTMLNILGGMDTVTHGQLNFLGDELATKSKKELAEFRRQIGFIFQSFHLIWHLSVFDNVAMPLRLTRTNEVTIRKKVIEALSSANYTFTEQRLKQLPGTLSNGEKQRVAIARALVVNPTVILADEPTGSLDSGNAVAILNLLQQIHQSQPWVSIILVSHNEDIIENYCQRVLRLADGKLVSDHPIMRF